MRSQFQLQRMRIEIILLAEIWLAVLSREDATERKFSFKTNDSRVAGSICKRTHAWRRSSRARGFGDQTFMSLYKTRGHTNTACQDCKHSDWSTQLGDSFCQEISEWKHNWRWRADTGCEEDFGGYDNPVPCQDVNPGPEPCPHFATKRVNNTSAGTTCWRWVKAVFDILTR